MDNLKEYGDLIYSYFNGPGKKFYVTYKELVDNKVPGEEYEDKLYPEFVHYAMKYASSHKNTKFIIEGVWLFSGSRNSSGKITKYYFEPSEFDNYAFYIKGTSMLISKYRAAKRDDEDGKSFKNLFFRKNWKWYFLDENHIHKFRKYFKSKIKDDDKK